MSNSSNLKTQAALLTAVVATGAGGWIPCQDYDHKGFTVIAANVTSGGTLKLEGQDFGGNTVPLNTFTVTANGNLWFTTGAPLKAVRGNLTARTDGTYTLLMDARLCQASVR